MGLSDCGDQNYFLVMFAYQIHIYESDFFFSCSQLACKIPGMKNLLWIVSPFYLDHIY